MEDKSSFFDFPGVDYCINDFNLHREINSHFSRQIIAYHSSVKYSLQVLGIHRQKFQFVRQKFTRYPNTMNEYRADRSLSTVSNIIPLPNENINPIRDHLQCPLCIFTASSRYAIHTINLIKHIHTICTVHRHFSFTSSSIPSEK